MVCSALRNEDEGENDSRDVILHRPSESFGYKCESIERSTKDALQKAFLSIDVATDSDDSSDGYNSERCSPSSLSSTLTDTSLSSQASCSFTSTGTESSVSSLGEPKELDLLDVSCALDELDADKKSPDPSPGLLRKLRCTYLLVTLVIMLADGLQGTHLYVLYESYGFSPASLYCLGFATGGLLSPLTGPLVDRMGRKRAALLYCGLEIFINILEQFPFFYGLVASRMIGGLTTNLLSTVFETWLDTEYRDRGLARDKYELIMRDSVIVSNLAAIFSGYLAHVLAEKFGAVGPFRGAVTCTAVAFIVVLCVWSENYGTSSSAAKKDDDNEASAVETGSSQTIVGFLREAVSAYWHNSHMMRVGVSQGLTAGSVQIFVFLWVPALRHFASLAPKGTLGLDKDGEPAYGLIFGAYMAAGVVGGFLAPPLRRWVTSIVSPVVSNDGDSAPVATVEVDGEGIVPVRPMAVELLAASCYFISAMLLSVPCMSADDDYMSFSTSLVAFLAFETLVGIFLPCEGVIRSLYFPTNARASIMTLPQVIVNVAVALGVVSTNFISLKTSFAIVGSLMATASALQLSLVSQREWSSLFSRASDFGEKCVAAPARRLSSSMPPLRRISLVSQSSMELSDIAITRAAQATKNKAD